MHLLLALRRLALLPAGLHRNRLDTRVRWLNVLQSRKQALHIAATSAHCKAPRLTKGWHTRKLTSLRAGHLHHIPLFRSKGVAAAAAAAAGAARGGVQGWPPVTSRRRRNRLGLRRRSLPLRALLRRGRSCRQLLLLLGQGLARLLLLALCHTLCWHTLLPREDGPHALHRPLLLHPGAQRAEAPLEQLGGIAVVAVKRLLRTHCCSCCQPLVQLRGVGHWGGCC